MDAKDFSDVPLLEGLTPQQLATVASHFTEVYVRSGEELTHEAEHGATFYIVLDGSVRVKIGERPPVELAAGDHFGEVALVTGERRNATVKAFDTSRLAKMMAWNFAELMENNELLATRIQAAATARRND